MKSIIVFRSESESERLFIYAQTLIKEVSGCGLTNGVPLTAPNQASRRPAAQQSHKPNHLYQTDAAQSCQDD